MNQLKNIKTIAQLGLMLVFMLSTHKAQSKSFEFIQVQQEKDFSEEGSNDLSFSKGSDQVVLKFDFFEKLEDDREEDENEKEEREREFASNIHWSDFDYHRFFNFHVNHQIIQFAKSQNDHFKVVPLYLLFHHLKIYLA